MIAGVVALAGCGGPDHLGPIQAGFDSQGRLHVLARHRSAEDEGGGWSYDDFHHAVRTRQGWSSQIVQGSGGASQTSPGHRYLLALDADDRPMIFTDTDQGLVVQVENDGSWVDVSRRSSLPTRAVESLALSSRLNHAWLGSDGIVRVLVGEWILEIQDGQLMSATDTGFLCMPTNRASYEDCLFSSTGDRQGQAVIYHYQESEVVTLRSLTYADADYQWTLPGVELGTMSIGGSSHYTRRSFFHLADGTPVLVRPVNVEVGENYAVQANWPGGEATLVSENVFVAGAGPRPGGGYLVVALTYSDRLRLVVVDEDWASRILELGTGDELHTSEPLTVLGEQTATGELAHVFVGRAGTQVDHYTVDLEVDAIEVETFEL